MSTSSLAQPATTTTRLRLGELLVQAGLITEKTLSEALTVQVMWGGRLGTVLSELGYIDLDTLSRALGWQYSLPAALAKHFDQADPALQACFDPDIAEWFGCIPLLRAGRRIVVATIAPFDDRGTATVARALKVDSSQLVPSIAAELRIRFQLERVYKISRSHRFLRAPGTERTTSAATPPADVPIPADAVLDPYMAHAPVTSTKIDGLERRSYVPTLGERPDVPASPHGLATPAHGAGEFPPTVVAAATWDEALRRIGCAIDLADIAELAVDTIARFVTGSVGAALLVTRGRVATNWTNVATIRLPIAVALERTGLPRDVAQSGHAIRAAAGAPEAADYQLLAALGGEREDLVLAPVKLDGAVAAIVAVAMRTGVQSGGIEEVATAAGIAFTRLCSDASRGAQGGVADAHSVDTVSRLATKKLD